LKTGEVFVNEVNLTGESIPVPKTEIDMGLEGELCYKEDQKFNTKSILYEGTTLIKIRPTNKRLNNMCVAYVQRTGFMTFKGQIFRSLVFVKNRTALFQVTAGKFILLLALMGLAVGLILLV
jgi:cation-transporting ATPase 13A3/4/5